MNSKGKHTVNDADVNVGAQLSLPKYTTDTLPTDITRITEEDIPEMNELTGKQRMLVQALVRNNYNVKKAVVNELQGKVSERYAYAALNLYKVSSVLNAAKELVARRALEHNAWSFDDSVSFARRILRYLEAVLTSTSPQSILGVKSIVDVTRAMQFWKDNLDKMHAYLVTEKNITRITEVKELKSMSDEDIIALGEALRHLASKSRTVMLVDAVDAEAHDIPDDAPVNTGEHAQASKKHADALPEHADASPVHE